MSDLKLKITTIAQLKGLEDTKRALTEASKATKELGQSNDKLEQEIKQVDAALNSESASAVRAAESLKKAIAATQQSKGNAAPLKQQLAGIQSQYGLPTGNFLMDQASKLPVVGNMVQSVAPAMAGGGTSAALAAGAAATALALKTSSAAITEFAGAEERVASLDAALAQSGQLTDEYRERLQRLAGEFQSVTGVADDQWIAVLARLTQFGSKPETVGVDMEAVKNLAGIMKGDLIGAADAYSRALQGNYEIFSRYGIVVEEAGTQTERLTKLQEQLAERGGGQLEARNKTLIGQWQQLKNNFSDLLEAYGRGIAATGFLQRAMDSLSTTFGWWAEKLGGTVPQVEGLRNVTREMATVADSAATATSNQADAADKLATNSKKAASALAEQLKKSEELRRHQDKLADLEMAGELLKLEGSKLPEAEKIKEEQRIRQKYAERKRDSEKGGVVEKMERTAEDAADAATQHANLQRAIQEQENRVRAAEQIEGQRKGLEDRRKTALAEAKRLTAAADEKEEFLKKPSLSSPRDLAQARKDRDTFLEQAKGEEARAELARQSIERFNQANPQVTDLPQQRKRLEELYEIGKRDFHGWEERMETAPSAIRGYEEEMQRMDEIHAKERANERLHVSNTIQKAQTQYLEKDATSAGPVTDRQASLNIRIAENNLEAAGKLDEASKSQGEAARALVDLAFQLQTSNSWLIKELESLKRVGAGQAQELRNLNGRVNNNR